MFTPDTETAERAYLNGRFVSRHEAVVSAADFGILYGFGLFETMRAYGGILFRLDRHLDRLLQGAAALGFSHLLDRSALVRACESTVKENRLLEARVRLTVTPGESDAPFDRPEYKQATVLVTAKPYAQVEEEAFMRGLSAVISAERRCSGCSTVAAKTVSYAQNLRARQGATVCGAQEAIFLNERGTLAEGSATNLFIVRHGIVATPSADCGILAGIARREIVELALAGGLPVEEREVSLEDLWCADEAFLTNSVVEIMPLTKVNGEVVGGGQAGAVTIKLRKAYRVLVDRFTGGGLQL